jgi:hypothetical protein
MALRLVAAIALLAVRCIQILLMMKGFPAGKQLTI